MFSKVINSIYYLTINLVLHKVYSECPTRIPMPLTAYNAVPRSDMPSINQFFPYLSEQSNITSLVSHNNLIKFITAKEINSEITETETEQLTAVTKVSDSNLSSVITNDGIEEEKLTIEKVIISNETLTKESDNIRKLDIAPKFLSSHQIKKKMMPAVKTKPKYIQRQNDNPTALTPKMIPIFKPKENIRNNNVHRALQTPVNNLNINSNAIKPDIPYQTLSNDKPPKTLQTPVNNLNINSKAIKSDIPYQTLSNDKPPKTLQTPVNNLNINSKAIKPDIPYQTLPNDQPLKALQTPVNNLNIISKTIKPDIPYQTLPNAKPLIVQPQLNEMKFNANLNPVLKSTKFDLPCQRASDILNEPVNDILKGNPTCRMKPVERKQFLNLKPTINRLNRNLQCQRLPNIKQRLQKITTANSKDALVLMKPKTTTITKDYGNFVKKITTAVLLPSCVVNLTA